MNDEDEAAQSPAAPETYMEAETQEEPIEKKRLVRPEYSPVQVLLAKLERWLVQQPEWAYILAAPRKTRREAITLISKRLLTIPNRFTSFGEEKPDA